MEEGKRSTVEHPGTALVPGSPMVLREGTPSHLAVTNRDMPVGNVVLLMDDRERGETGEFVETITPERVLGVFAATDGPVVTSRDVADELGCSTEVARRKLAQLHDEGRVDRRKTGRTVVWWRVGDGSGGEERRGSSGIDPDDAFWTAEPGSSVEPTDAARADEYLADALADE